MILVSQVLDVRVCVYLIGAQQGGGRTEVPVVRAVLGGDGGVGGGG